MNKLISMEDYVLESTNSDDMSFRNEAIKYAKLLKSKPTLSMFVPCDDKGFLNLDKEHTDKVIFDGWSVYEKQKNIVNIQTPQGMIWINFQENGLITLNGHIITSLSDLTPYNLPLKNKL